jgi:hypothetical protein
VDETVSLFKKVVTELKNQWNPETWNPETLKNTIDEPHWDHVLVQAFFAHLGKKLGFETACEKFMRWDVAWFKDSNASSVPNWVRVEVELRKFIPVQEAFGQICKISEESEKFDPPGNFSGILVVNDCLLVIPNSDYFYDNFLKPEEVSYPQNKALDILIIDVEQRKSRHAKVGPIEKYEIVKDDIF